MLVIDNTAFGALASFPLLLALDSTRIDFSKTVGKGDDLRFTDAAGTLLAYEVEDFAPPSATVWVNVPAIAPHAMTVIWMYYGNRLAKPADDASKVWDATFVGVWHLKDAKDTTARNGSSNHGAQPTATGRIGPAMTFSGNNQYIDTGAAQQLATWTVEAWAKSAAAPNESGWYGPVMRDQNYGIGWDCNPAWWPKSAQAISVLIAGADAGPCLSGWCRASFGTPGAADALVMGTWYDTVATFDGQTLRAFTDGSLHDAQPVVGTPGNASGGAKIGANLSNDRFFNGTVDEVRISNVVRSPDWISAQYRAMTDQYVTYKDEQAN
jgi:hypothetical protein